MEQEREQRGETERGEGIGIGTSTSTSVKLFQVSGDSGSLCVAAHPHCVLEKGYDTKKELTPKILYIALLYPGGRCERPIVWVRPVYCGDSFPNRSERVVEWSPSQPTRKDPSYRVPSLLNI
jgi:hypothetical protein